MDVSRELQTAMSVLLAGDFVSQREYDAVVMSLRHMCDKEHRRLTLTEDGDKCISELTSLCRNFVADVYFGGVFPNGVDTGLRRLAKRLSAEVSKYLRSKCEVGGKLPIYNDELSEMRIQLLNRDGVCQAVESKFSAKVRETLVELRTGVKPQS